MTAVRGAAVGGALAWSAQRALAPRPPGGPDRWQRHNHRGRTVSLLSGPALALAAVASADLPRPAAAVAGLGAAGLGAYDDVAGERTASVKGLRGHVGDLRQGRISSGVVKLVGLSAVGLTSCALLEDRRGLRDLLVGGAVVAGAANLLNLLDLRPGRALKAGTAVALLLAQPGPAAAAAVLLPGDLTERTMLGDAGANSLGAVLGLALLRHVPERRVAALVVLTALTAASEVVSYSRVIDAVPVLRWVDRVGRLP